MICGFEWTAVDGILTVCQMKENHSEDFHQAGIHLFRDGIASVEDE